MRKCICVPCVLCLASLGQVLAIAGSPSTSAAAQLGFDHTACAVAGATPANVATLMSADWCDAATLAPLESGVQSATQAVADAKAELRKLGWSQTRATALTTAQASLTSAQAALATAEDQLRTALLAKLATPCARGL